MSYIWNTDLFSIENRKHPQYEMRPSKPLAEALLTKTKEGEVVIGDPTDFNIKDRLNGYNDFDQGWDLEGGEDDVFVGMR